MNFLLNWCNKQFVFCLGAVWILLVLATAIQNTIFAIRYGCRVLSIEAAISIAVMYGICFVLCSLFAQRLITERLHPSIFFVACIGILVLGGILLGSIAQSSVVNDRYYMIQIFWDQLIHGVNPYNPMSGTFSNNVPGGYPFYFLLAFPGWLAGEIGILHLSGFLIYFFLISFLFRKNTRLKIIALIPIVLSVSFWYEFPARSTLFFNMVICLAYIIWLNATNIRSVRTLIVVGIAGGVVLSTRTIALFPIITLYAYLLQQKQIQWKSLLLICTCHILVFLAPIALLYLWHPHDFSINNPFMVQTTYGNLVFCVALCGLSLFAGILAKKPSHLILLCAIILCCSVIGKHLLVIFQVGWQLGIFSNKPDISYVVIPLPFFGIALALYYQKNYTHSGSSN